MLLHSNAADALCLLTRWQYSYAWSDVMAAMLKVWRQIQNRTSVNRCVFTWRTFLSSFIPRAAET